MEEKRIQDRGDSRPLKTLTPRAGRGKLSAAPRTTDPTMKLRQTWNTLTQALAPPPARRRGPDVFPNSVTVLPGQVLRINRNPDGTIALAEAIPAPRP